MERLALAHKPKLIIGGGSAYSREWDYARMRKIADEVGALFMVDMAHPAGLIAAGLLDNPVKYAHIVTTTTHKTLRGPRGGVILMGKDFENPWGITTKKGEVRMMSSLLNSAVFPGTQGGPLEHVIAAKAVAFGENLLPSWKEYATQVKKNAAVLADDLISRGFDIVSGGTALTTRGAKEDMMHLVAELIEEVLNAPEDEQVIARVREKVNETMKAYPLFAY